MRLRNYLITDLLYGHKDMYLKHKKNIFHIFY
jgi:hypothetical protein